MEVIRQYTGFESRRLNAVLNRGEHPEGADELNAALQSLPALPGTAFRTIWVDDLDRYLAERKIARTITFPAFTSTSRSEIQARRFSGNVLFRIEGKSGRDIAPFSERPWEAETLFPAGMTFWVQKIKINKLTGPGGVPQLWSLEIHLIE